MVILIVYSCVLFNTMCCNGFLMVYSVVLNLFLLCLKKKGRGFGCDFFIFFFFLSFFSSFVSVLLCLKRFVLLDLKRFILFCWT